VKPLDVLRRITAVPFDGMASPVVLPDCGRKQLRMWWKALGAKTGAEIGVWEGAFARTICDVTGAFLYAVDPWEPQVGYLEVKNDKARMDRALLRTKNALSPFPHQIVKATSLDASKKIADRSLDFAYIDGNHLKDHVLADIAAWAPKVKSGGILSGHDARVYPSKPFIQVMDALGEYTKAHEIGPWFIFASDKSPSWAWVVA
jgi:hypothetical protein